MFMKKSIHLVLLLGVGFLAVPACKLDPPPAGQRSDAGAAFTCTDDQSVDAGATSGGSTSSNIDNVVTPVSCNGDNSAAALSLFAYAPGYTTDPALAAKVQQTINNMSLDDELLQMAGMPYGSAYATQMTNTQKSQDTAKIRGFHYRDASRGMNLAEDMDGSKPNAGLVPGSTRTTTGYSTAFPVSMARGAAFDLDLENAIGEAIGDEMQAAQETLLLAPCMNVLRHPLWGRAQETYGEDPFHVGRLASALALGVQQHIAANAKHYLAYDIENNRSINNSAMDEQTLREIYGRHFRMVVQDAGVASVMASYNLVNGKNSTQNRHLLTEVLRDDFGFKGFVLSDWWAMPGGVKVSNTTVLKAQAVEALKAGLDVELPWVLNYGQLGAVIGTAGVTKSDIDASVARILEQKFRFNADNLNGNVGLGSTKTAYVNGKIQCDGSHVKLAQKAAVESMVLLKNDNSTLPINPSVTKVAVISAKNVPYVTTNDSSNTANTITFATDVLTGDLGSSRVFHDPSEGRGPAKGLQDMAPSGVTVVTGSSADEAANADFIVVMAGLTPGDEGEEYTLAGDRDSFALDAKMTKDAKYKAFVNIQNDLIASVAALNKPMVVVLEGGSVIDLPWLANVPAVVMAWYPGMVGGESIGQLLWGQANFGGKLPFTWGKQLSDYPTFNGNGTTQFDYYMGYRYFDKNNIAPLFPFGYGLSYTKFEYSKLQLGCSDMSQGAVLPVVVNVANTGGVAGDEVVMVFVSFVGTQARRGVKELKGFQRVHLEAGEAKQVTIPVRLKDLDYFQMDSATGTTGKWVVESGDVKVMVGGSSTNLPLSATVKVNGY